MNNLKQYYIRALVDLLQTGHSADKALSDLRTLLERKRHMRLYRGILEGILRDIENGVISEKPQVFVAHEKDAKNLKGAITTALKELETDDSYDTVTDATLIGGFIATANHKRIDKSYKSALLTLYRNITR